MVDNRLEGIEERLQALELTVDVSLERSSSWYGGNGTAHLYGAVPARALFQQYRAAKLIQSEAGLPPLTLLVVIVQELEAMCDGERRV